MSKLLEYRAKHLPKVPPIREAQRGYTSIDLERVIHKLDFDVYLPTKQCNLQRTFVWTLEQQQELIRSVLFGRAIPDVCIVAHEINAQKDVYQVIDGKQRLTTLINFIQGKFDVDGYTFKDFGRDFLTLVKIKCVMYYSDQDRPITDEQKIGLFKLINFSGTEHI
jgi:hypothetical protein